MYKIPEYYNLKKLENKAISQIAFGLNFISLFFSNGFIQFSGSFSFVFEGMQNLYTEVHPVRNDYKLLNLLEKKLKSIAATNEANDLTLEFDDGIILVLIGNKEYESYKFNIDGREVIV